MEKSTHPDAVAAAYARMLKESPAEGKFITIGAGTKIHVIEAGTGHPLFFLHGGGAAANSLLPLIRHLDGIRTIVPDRPGYGLSDPVDTRPKGYRATAVDVMDQILDALGVDQITLAGSSGGGVWAIWYALTHPERVQRLIIMGSAPLLPKTNAQIVLRVMVTPILGDLMSLIPANESMVVQMMGMMGEKHTIVKYPALIQAMAASSHDPVASRTTRAEYAAFLNFRGFKPDMKIRAQDLARLAMPSLVIWGEHDPVGGVDAARAVSDAIPNSKLELLPTGHVPWLGYPEQAARLVLDFIHTS